MLRLVLDDDGIDEDVNVLFENSRLSLCAKSGDLE
jgi:hypothetical protein